MSLMPLSFQQEAIIGALLFSQVYQDNEDYKDAGS